MSPSQFDTLLAEVNSQSAASPFSNGTAVAYSGVNGNSQNEKIAIQCAEQNRDLNYYTIFDTEVGQFLTNSSQHGGIDIDDLFRTGAISLDQYNQLWQAASANFASEASGNVIAVVNGVVDPTRTFATIELRDFAKNPNVTSINGINASDLNILNQDGSLNTGNLANIISTLGPLGDDFCPPGPPPSGAAQLTVGGIAADTPLQGDQAIATTNAVVTTTAASPSNELSIATSIAEGALVIGGLAIAAYSLPEDIALAGIRYLVGLAAEALVVPEIADNSPSVSAEDVAAKLAPEIAYLQVSALVNEGEASSALLNQFSASEMALTQTRAFLESTGQSITAQVQNGSDISTVTVSLVAGNVVFSETNPVGGLPWASIADTYSSSGQLLSVLSTSESISPASTLTQYLSNGFNEVTDYSQDNGQGEITFNALQYEVQPSDTFASIASALGMGSGGGVSLAALNQQSLAGEHPNGDFIDVPISVGAPQDWSLTATPQDMTGTDDTGGTYTYTVTTQTFTLSGSGILNLDTDSFTPLNILYAGSNSVARIFVVDGAGDLLGSLTEVGINANVAQISLQETLTQVPAQTDSLGNAVQASQTIAYQAGPSANDFNESTGSYTTTTGTFAPPSGGAALPFFAENGGTTTTANASKQLLPGNYHDPAQGDYVASFNSTSNTPDLAWSVGVNTLGDAVISGNSGSGYNGTATLTQGEAGTTAINAVELDGTAYALTVIGNHGLKGALYAVSLATIVAEGTGTSTVDISNGNPIYWHINGHNDNITLDSLNTEFYFAQPESAYSLAWNATTGALTVTGGSTGKTTFQQGVGGGEINFADGSLIGLGYSPDSSDPVLYGNYFSLDGGDQSVFAAANKGQVTLSAGSDDPGDWAISQKTGVNGVLSTVFDGIDAGYDGIATLTGVSQITLNDQTYALDEIAAGKSLTTKLNTSGQNGNIITDSGNATVKFADQLGEDYWFVGGAGDKATINSDNNVEVYFSGDESAYSFEYDANGNLLVTGGTTGTTTISIAVEATGELNFGDGNVVGLGDAGDAVEYGGSGSDTFTINSDTTAYGGGGNDTFILNAGNDAIDGGTGTNSVIFGSVDIEGYDDASEDSAGQVIIDGQVAGYDGIVSLTNIAVVDGLELITTPSAGGTTVVPNQNGTTVFGDLVVDAAGNDTLNIQDTQYTVWDVGTGNNTADLNAGYTLVNMAGNEADYAVSYDNNGILTLTDTVSGRNGVSTFVIGAGTGQIDFADGNVIGLGQAAGPVNYGGAGNDTFEFDNHTPETVYGGGGFNTAIFDGVGFGNKFSLSETSAGVVVAKGTAAGNGNFDSTATLVGIQSISFGSVKYDLIATTTTAESLVVKTPTDGAAGSAVVEGTANYGLALNSGRPTYIYAGSGKDSLAINAGTNTEYFSGAIGDYTQTLSGTKLAITNTGNKDHNGTQTFTLTGTAKAQLKAVFAGNNMVYHDGAGSYSISFTGAGQSDWYAGAGTTTATLSAGTTDISLAGPASDYTETYSGSGNSTLTITNIGDKDGVGTKTLLLKGGAGELTFGSGSPISFGAEVATATANADPLSQSGASILLTDRTTLFNLSAGELRFLGGNREFDPLDGWRETNVAEGQLLGFRASLSQFEAMEARLHSEPVSAVSMHEPVVYGVLPDDLTVQSAVPLYWHS